MGRLTWSRYPSELDYPIELELIKNLPVFLRNYAVGWEPFPVEQALKDGEYFEALKKEAIAEYGEFENDEDLYEHYRIVFLNRKGYSYLF